MSNVAQIIIQKCGGPRAVADWLGVRLPTVYRWTYPKVRGGTGGVIPVEHQAPLIVAARVRGINLNPDDFFDLSRLGERV